MTELVARLAALRQRIDTACRTAGRASGSVRLLAVSKAVGSAAIRAAGAAGQREFGENYVQEAMEKMSQLADAGLTWHFIGPIQSNKTRAIAENFAWAQSVDREKIARRLAEQRPPGRGPLQVCVQVNISGEASKSGCAPGEALALCTAIARLPTLQLRGLMAIPAPGDPGAARGAYRRLRELFEEIRAALAAPGFDTLSAGMTEDLDVAIAEGSTLVRVGTAIFGER